MYDIINVILNSNSILLMTHNSPDGDGIGCLIALENILKQLNKEIFVVIQNKISKNYINIIGKERVNKIFLPNKKYDLIIILDCSDINRIYEKCVKSLQFNKKYDRIGLVLLGTVYVYS